jgi:hypothetical protein
MTGLSRRGFLGGAAGLAAVAALPPLSGSSRAVTMPLLGATVDLHSYGVKDYIQAANIFDGYVGMPFATTLQKVLLQSSEFPTSPGTQLTELSGAGCQFLISVEPSTVLTSSEQTRLANYLSMLNNAGITYRVILFSEANDTAFTDQQAWQAYWSYYAPVIKAAGVPLAYCPGCNNQSIARAQAFFPSNPTPDELWLDFYATAVREGVRIDQLVAQAKAVGISVGLAEWGWHAGHTLLNPMTLPWWNLYCAYLTHIATGGNLALGAAYYNDSPGTHPVNAIGATNDPRIPGILRIYNAIKAA